MPWPTEELKRRFDRPENAELLRYLEGRSPHAHSDLGILLFQAARELPGVAFALAAGMKSLILRLPRPYPETEAARDIGPGWEAGGLSHRDD